MQILTLIFHLGILFSAFAFLWFWIQLALVIILPDQVKIPIRYFLQLLQSLFLGVLVLKFVFNEHGSLTISSQLVLSLLTYFLYLLRNIKTAQQTVHIQIYSSLYQKLKMKNDWEWAVALISIAVTTVWVFYPIALDSVFTNWFYNQTHELINVPIIGWLFKVAGFFFLIATLVRFLSALSWMLRGRTTAPEIDDENKFDDFEELK
jgi:hypothetical protein